MSTSDISEAMKSPAYDDPTLKDLIRDMWRAKWYVLIALIFCVSAAVTFVANTPPYYRASLVIGPAPSPLDAISPQRFEAESGVLLSPAQIRQSSTDDARRDSFTRMEIILTGRAVANAIFQNDALMAGLRFDRWAIPQKDSLTVADIDEYLDKVIKIRFVGNTAMRKVIYHHPDKLFAREFLTAIVKAANDHVKKQDLADMTSRIEQLKNVLRTSNNPAQKQALAFLLTLEEQRLMLFSIDVSHVGQIVDPPASTPAPVWPRFSLFMIFSIIIGGVAGYTLFCLVRVFRS